MTTDESRPDQSTGAPVIVARPAVIAARRRRATAQADLMTRRSLLRSGFWAGLGVTSAGLLLGFVNYAWPRKVARAGGVILVPAADVPAPGADPEYVQSGRFYLVNLRPGDGIPAAFADLAEPAQRGGLLALAQKCPHLGCSIPWRPDFSASETRGVTGWFRCPCHMSTYSTAGVRVHGPAPRSMDLFAVTIRPDGSVEVDTTRIKPGSTENPQHAVFT